MLAPFPATLVFWHSGILLLSFPATVCFAITHTKYKDIQSSKIELELLKTINEMLPPDQFVTVLPSKQKKIRDTH